MMNRLHGAILALVALLLLAPCAWAHKVKVFASVEGDRVVCRGYFADGAAPKDCPVTVFLPDGGKMVEGKTDDAGKFVFRPTRRADLRIVLNAGEGHFAEYTLRADKLPADLAGASSAESPEGAKALSSAAASAKEEPPPAAAIDEARLRAVVRDELQKQLDPVYDKLTEMQMHNPGPTEIIGGIGYILGLMGVALYFRSRSREKSREKS